jgi:hypothetical protein
LDLSSLDVETDQLLSGLPRTYQLLRPALRHILHWQPEQAQNLLFLFKQILDSGEMGVKESDIGNIFA